MTEEIKMPPRWLKTLGKTVKWILIGLAVAIIGWLCLRAVWQKGPKSFRRYVMTSDARKVYDENGLDVYRLNALNANDLDQLFFIDGVYYTAEKGSYQFMMRYNIYAEKAAGLIPEEVRFTVVDSKGNEYRNYRYDTKNTAMYWFYLVVFEDLPKNEEMKIVVTDGVKRLDSVRLTEKDGFREPYTLSETEKKVFSFTKEIRDET